MELLSPAGNPEKLYYAWTYGADAAYIGLQNFSLRARADNFRQEDWRRIEMVKGGKKLFIALNIHFHDSDIDRLRGQLEQLHRYPVDAFIISDIGVLPLLRREFPGVALHLSTQANCLNSEAARLYRDLGFSRIILARELDLDSIRTIRERLPDLELEAFVHGAMCLAYSGRCFLSAYMTGRSANQGDCAHSCRWNYRLEEQERPGEYYPVIAGDNFTTLLSSRDLCMIDHLADLKDAGVDSIKIEGRMKSVYYTAVVTRAYRKALDALEGRLDDDPAGYRNELDKVSHREYSTGFYYGREEMDRSTDKSYVREYLFLGTVLAPADNGRFHLNVKNQIRETDRLEVIGPDLLFQELSVFQLYDEEGNTIAKADHGKTYFIESAFPLKEGYILRKRNPSL